jgi:YkoP domain
MSVFSQHSGQLVFPTYWLENAVFGLDRWLRRRQGVFEYSDDPACLFRIQRAQAEEHVTLSDGARIALGDPVLNLHMWNEHMPLMGHDGATVAWARTASRSIRSSLGQLATYLHEHPEFDDIAALRADMRLGTAEQSAQLARLSAHYGFEAPAGLAPAGYWRSGGLHRFGENILIFMLVLATNPVAVGTPVLRRDHKLVYLSRVALKRRYGGAWADCNDVRSPGAC